MTFSLGSCPALAASNLNNHGGATMQNSLRAFLIYWLPSGAILDSSVSNGIGNFETLTQRFYSDLSATPYLNIVTQYPGQCGSNQCVLENITGAAALGGGFVDTQAYPSNKGTATNPLQDSDIRDEVTRAISQNHWSVNENSEFFVITGMFKATGTGVVECNGSMCTLPGGFCAYHGNFSQNNSTVLYGYLSDANFNSAGCGEGLTTAVNTQTASDWEVAMMSHEFFETITDPQSNTWWDSSSGNEIGDNCNQSGTQIAMNGNNYWVQQQWSNATTSCVSAFGPSVQLKIGTGSDDLRGDSSATTALESAASVSFETFSLKAESDPGWGNNTTHIVVSDFNQPSQSALGEIGITLTSHNNILETNDNWNIQSLVITVFSPTGGVLCSQSLSGNPLARLTGQAPTVVFATPNCQPQAVNPEGVVCSVFDDGYTNLVGSSDAVFVNGDHQACIPSSGRFDGSMRMTESKLA